MSPKISFHEAAEIELKDAADFYDIACPNLGSVFIDDVQRVIGKISEFPDAAPVIRGKIRKKPIAKFPFSVIYSVNSDEIRILAVAHQKRRPFYWSSRY
jgi:plasmid stabilization system protein ParE